LASGVLSSHSRLSPTPTPIFAAGSSPTLFSPSIYHARILQDPKIPFPPSYVSTPSLSLPFCAQLYAFQRISTSILTSGMLISLSYPLPLLNIMHWITAPEIMPIISPFIPDLLASRAWTIWRNACAPSSLQATNWPDSQQEWPSPGHEPHLIALTRSFQTTVHPLEVVGALPLSLPPSLVPTSVFILLLRTLVRRLYGVHGRSGAEWGLDGKDLASAYVLCPLKWQSSYFGAGRS
jgi:hypothetical protein